MNREIKIPLAVSEIVFLLYLLDVWYQFREDLLAQEPESEDYDHYKFEATFANILLSKISDVAILESERAFLKRCLELDM